MRILFTPSSSFFLDSENELSNQMTFYLYLIFQYFAIDADDDVKKKCLAAVIAMSLYFDLNMDSISEVR